MSEFNDFLREQIADAIDYADSPIEFFKELGLTKADDGSYVWVNHNRDDAIWYWVEENVLKEDKSSVPMALGDWLYNQYDRPALMDEIEDLYSDVCPDDTDDEEMTDA